MFRGRWWDERQAGPRLYKLWAQKRRDFILGRWMVLSREMTCDLHFPWVICLLGRAVGRSGTGGAKGSPRLRVWMQLEKERKPRGFWLWDLNNLGRW